MTVEAPFHMQGRSPPCQRHVIDTPVARLTVDAFRGVYAMVEIDEVRQVVYSDPAQRLLCLPTLMNRRQHFTIHPELRVAAEAQLCSWHPGRGFRFDRAMAVSTIDSAVPHVMLMTETDGLRFHDANFRKIRRANNNGRYPECSDDEYHRPEHTDTSDRISTWMKDLWHAALTPCGHSRGRNRHATIAGYPTCYVAPESICSLRLLVAQSVRSSSRLSDPVPAFSEVGTSCPGDPVQR